MSHLYFYFLLATILYFEINCQFFKRNEKVVAFIDHFLPCGREEDNRFKLHLSTHKYNRTHIATDMNITVFEPFGSEYTVDVEFRVWGDGGWKHNLFRYSQNNACKTLYVVLGKAWTNIVDAAKAPRTCPIPVGFYAFHDYYIGVSNLPFLTRTGKFLFIGNITKHGVQQTCLIASIIVKTEILY